MIWHEANLSQSEYSRLPVKEKMRLIKKFHPEWITPLWRKWFNQYRLWRNKPKEGYLLNRWLKSNAEAKIGQGSPPDSWYNPKD